LLADLGSFIDIQRWVLEADECTESDTCGRWNVAHGVVEWTGRVRLSNDDPEDEGEDQSHRQ